MSGDDSGKLQKELAKIAAAAEGLREAVRSVGKAREDLARRAFAIGDELGACDGPQRTLAGSAAVLAAFASWRTEVEREAADARARASRAIPADLDRILAPEGLRVEGHLPRLRCGLFGLVFELSAKKPDVAIEFGPGVAVLGRAAVAPEAIAEALRVARAELEAGRTPPATFLAELREALAVARHRLRLGASERVPIVAALAELAWVRQSTAFRSDPSRARFTPYSRVAFSYDLGMLSSGEVLLTIATREQTKSPEDSLWVPRGERGDGAHYAAITIREAEATR